MLAARDVVLGQQHGGVSRRSLRPMDRNNNCQIDQLAGTFLMVGPVRVPPFLPFGAAASDKKELGEAPAMSSHFCAVLVTSSLRVKLR